MRAKGYKCYNVLCGSCIFHAMCGEPGDAPLTCADRVVNDENKTEEEADNG